eukprot:scaffold644741_cov19-Prasinocladus_malaysianus.AAC.1
MYNANLFPSALIQCCFCLPPDDCEAWHRSGGLPALPLSITFILISSVNDVFTVGKTRHHPSVRPVRPSSAPR